MKIPSRIRLKARIAYEVVFVEEFPPEPDGGTCWGECRYEKRQIALRTKGHTPRKQFSTLIHEVIHAAQHEYGLNITEAQVDGLEKAFMNILTLNKLV